MVSILSGSGSSLDFGSISQASLPGLLGVQDYEDFSLGYGETKDFNTSYGVYFLIGTDSNVAMLFTASYRGIAILNGNYDQDVVTITNNVGSIRIKNNMERVNFRLHYIKRG